MRNSTKRQATYINKFIKLISFWLRNYICNIFHCILFFDVFAKIHKLFEINNYFLLISSKNLTIPS